jgi:hypothetical protein
MFVIYHRIGTSAVLPALAATGVLVVIGGIAAMTAVTTLAIVAVAAVGIRVLRAFALDRAKRPLASQVDNTIEAVVVNRSSADSDPELTQPRGPELLRAAGPT